MIRDVFRAVISGGISKMGAMAARDIGGGRGGRIFTHWKRREEEEVE